MQDRFTFGSLLTPETFVYARSKPKFGAQYLIKCIDQGDILMWLTSTSQELQFVKVLADCGVVWIMYDANVKMRIL